MVEERKLFSTSLWNIKLDLDLDPIRKEVEKYTSRYRSKRASNIGGYQSGPFDYKPLTSAIKTTFLNLIKKWENCISIVGLILMYLNLII